MAERAPRTLLARLTQTMDNRQISDPRGHTLACHSTLFAVDESDPDEAVLHTSVAQRLAFWIQLDGLSLRHAQALTPLSDQQVEQARLCLQQMQTDPGALRALMEVAQSLGIENKAAKDYIDRYFTRFAGVRQYMDDTKQFAKEKGYVETVRGRDVVHHVVEDGGAPPLLRSLGRREHEPHATAVEEGQSGRGLEQ